MSFRPVVIGQGLSAWRFLQATLDRQTEAFDSSAPVENAADYFQKNIADISTAEDLVKDRRLLEISLTAFGLQDDINNAYFIQKVLSEGTIAEDALANKLSDTRYKEMAKAFAFDTLPQTQISSFPQKIIDLYQRRSFEVAVGEQNESFRIGLNLERALPKIATSSDPDDTKWFKVLGNPALREVFQTAFGLPRQFGQIDLDQQLTTFKEMTRNRFGSDNISVFSEVDKLNELVQLFFLQNQIDQSAAIGSPQVALTLLSSSVVSL